MASSDNLRKLRLLFEQHKMLFIVGAVVVVLGVMYMSTSSGSKRSKKVEKEKAPQIQSTSQDVVKAAMTPIAKPKEVEQKQQGSRNVVINRDNIASAPQKPAEPVKQKTPEKVVVVRPPTAMEATRSLYRVDYQPVALNLADAKTMDISATVREELEATKKAAEKQEADQKAALAAAAATETKAVEKKSKPTEIILPGTEIQVTLQNGMLASSAAEMHFVGTIKSLVGPKNSANSTYAGCLLTGTAKLNLITQRADARTASISCPDKYAGISAYGLGPDKTEGLPGAYYERLMGRLAYTMLGSGVGGYFQAKGNAMVQETTTSTGFSTGTSANVAEANWNEYAMNKALSDTAASAKDALKEFENRQIPVLVINPGSSAIFYVQSPTRVTFLTESNF